MDDLKMELFEEGDFPNQHVKNGLQSSSQFSNAYQNFQSYETFELYEVKHETDGTKTIANGIKREEESEDEEDIDIDGFIEDFLSDYVEDFLEIILYDYIVESIHENYENHMLDLIADENAELQERNQSQQNYRIH